MSGGIGFTDWNPLVSTSSPPNAPSIARGSNEIMAAACIFCKIIKGDIPSFKLFENDRLLAFLDIQPLSLGHASLSEILPVAKKLAQATQAENYNILQNNGRLAHQEVDHVHFHMIPKPNQTEGLGIEWPAQKTDMDKLKALFNDVKAKM
ncbi:MAG: hypothetical protein LQ348_000019 [Seirophora lacunosa]|nr:MAG: hypothetical protein LQ348_000019 [Seirophora lacunosa]